MRTRELLFAAGAMIAGVSLFAHPGSHPPPPAAIVFVPAPVATSMPLAVGRMVARDAPAPAADPARDDVFWDGEDAGIWAAAAEFDTPD